MAVNSWGGHWGEILTFGGLDLTLPGCFRIHKSLIADYTIPGIDEEGNEATDEVPWKIKQWSMAVATLDGFANTSLNADYIDSTFLVADHSVFCAVDVTDNAGAQNGSLSMESLTYSFPCLLYCNSWSRWLIVDAESVEKAREGFPCDKLDAYAQSPVVHADLNLKTVLEYEEKRRTLSHESWVEYNHASKKYEPRPLAAGVVGVTLPKPQV